MNTKKPIRTFMIKIRTVLLKNRCFGTKTPKSGTKNRKCLALFYGLFDLRADFVEDACADA